VPKEQVFPWDEDCGGTVRFDEDAIRLIGKRRMSVVGDVLTMGLAQPLLKRAFAKDVTVEIPIPQVERLTFLRSRSPLGVDIVRFRLFQRLPDGTPSVHVFVVGLTGMKKAPTLDQVVAGMQAVVPAAVVTAEGVQPAPAPAVPLTQPAPPQPVPAPPQPAAAQPPTPPDWYPDPTGRHQLRYWGGVAWTESVADNGAQSTDPMPTQSR
jgi:hypothetical protein